jgi:hypothetical protein
LREQDRDRAGVLALGVPDRRIHGARL